MDDFFSCIFEPYDNQGFVINTKGFPGSIQIEGNTFAKNMAYIKDYYIYENVQSQEYLTPSELQYSDFEEGSGQLNFKICDTNSYIG